jgi:ferrochelatase
VVDKAILFLQLGGPANLDEVPSFLYRLFSDPDVIRVKPAILRKAIAGSIALARTRTSRQLYRSIGGGSPIRRWTEVQAAAVEGLLRRAGHDALVRAAMNCSAPLVEDVVRELAGQGIRRFLAFPLYPQFSLTTTKGAIERSRSAVLALGSGAEFHEIGSWPTHAGFVAAHAEAIRDELARFPDPRPESVHLLYSAHSIPKKLVTRGGDPYPREVEASIGAINSVLGNRSPWSLAYQSKLGPVEWLGPATLDAIADLGRKGVRQVLAIPIAFVSDHVETLYEIDQLFGEAARTAGIEEFRRTPGLNDHATFLAALADIASSQRAFWE